MSAYLVLGGLLPFLLILGCFGACVGYRKLQSYKRKRESYKKLQKHRSGGHISTYNRIAVLLILVCKPRVA